jgi:hypothetical protein
MTATKASGIAQQQYNFFENRYFPVQRDRIWDK